MKILKSYKKITKELINEAAWDRKFGEPLPTLEDVMKENTVKFKDKDGKDHEIDMDTAKQYKQDVDGGDDSDYKKTAVKAAGLDKDDRDSEQPSGKALGGSDFERDFDDKGDEPKGDEEPKKLSSDEIDKKVKELSDDIRNIYHSMMSPQDSERYIDGLQKQIDDLKSQKESTKVINGKKYKAIKESKEPTKPTIHSFKETYKKIGGK